MISSNSSLLQFNPPRFLQLLISSLVSFVVFLVLSSFLLLPVAHSAQISLAWDPNSEADLAGYKVYYGVTQGGPYNSPGSPRIIVGNTPTYVLSGLTSGQMYYVVATAYDTSNNESGYSNEVRGVPAESVQTITVTTNPSGLQITVDGSAYAAPQTFSWVPGSSHTLSISSPQSVGSGARYVYSSWSDGGAQTHTITTPSSSTAYTASFSTQYSLITSVSTPGTGTVSPSGINWYNSGQSVSVSATANVGYIFSGWSGDLSGTTNSTSIIMNGPKNVAANFSTITETVSIPTIPSGPVSGTTGTSYSYTSSGSSSNLGHAVEYQFDWKGDGTDLSLWGSATQSKTWSVGSVGGAYNVRARARCVSHTSVVSLWSSSLSVSISQAAVSHTVTTNPSGLQITVDGSAYTAPRTFSWVPASSHTLFISSPQSVGSRTQYVYSSWSDGGAQAHTITAPSSSTTYTASFNTQYSLITSISLPGAGTVNPLGTNWYGSGQSVSVSATANPGYSFGGWSGDLLNTTSTALVTMDGPKVLTANFVQDQFLKIPLKAGPNLISFPTIVGEIPVADILSSISGQYEVVYSYEGCLGSDPWKMYDPEVPSYVNDLYYIDSAMGVWIEANQDTELNLSLNFPLTLSIPLCAGWNLISYPGSQAKGLAEALSSIAGQYEKVLAYKATDLSDPWKIYDTSVPSYVNDLTTLEPGLGYWIYVKQNSTLIVNN